MWPFGKKKKSTRKEISHSKPIPKRSEAQNKQIYQELRKSNPEFRRIDDRIKATNKSLEKILNANKQYKEDKDLNKVIKIYEHELKEPTSPWEHNIPQKHAMDLVDFYLKAGENDKAWGYLNWLTIQCPQLTSKVRFAQAKILKKENKYQDALIALMSGYLVDAKDMNGRFNSTKFTKEATVIANKLKWDGLKVEKLSEILGRMISNRDYNESNLRELFRDLIESWSIHDKKAE